MAVDRSRAADLYNAGLSTAKIAEFFGVNHTTVRHHLKKTGVVFRPPSRLRFGIDSYLFRHGLPVSKRQTQANNIVQKAVREGRLVPQSCEGCGLDGKYPNGRRKVQAHHEDYKKPMEVVWLCKSCHYKRHVDGEAQHRG